MGLKRNSKIQVHTPAGSSARDTPQAHCTSEPAQGADMRDHEAESLEFRKKLGNGGVVIIRVLPGKELGEISVSAQYEGKPSENDEDRMRCLEAHNDLAAQVGNWLKELFGDAAADIQVSIDAFPCPRLSDPLRIVNPWVSLAPLVTDGVSNSTIVSVAPQRQV